MKNLYIILPIFIIIFFGACTETIDKTTTISEEIEKEINALIIEDNKQIKIEIYNFYGNQKSKICDAIEVNTKQILNENFKNEIQKDIIKLYNINIDKDINKPTLEKFEVNNFGLYIMYTINGVENIENLTEFASMTALDNSEIYKRGIVTNLNDKLKKQL